MAPLVELNLKLKNKIIVTVKLHILLKCIYILSKRNNTDISDLNNDNTLLLPQQTIACVSRAVESFLYGGRGRLSKNVGYHV